MTSSLSIKKLCWFAAFTVLIVSSNILVYQLEALQPVTPAVAVGSLLDFIVVIPLLTYFFVIRKRYSLKYIPLVAIVGYGIAHLIIPAHHLTSYSFLRYILFAGEGAFLLVELYILYKIITKIPRVIRSFKSQTNTLTFEQRLESSSAAHLKSSRILDVYYAELAMVYYSLFSWRKAVSPAPLQFTYHQKTSMIALYVMLIHAMVIETVGLHFILHSISPVLSIVTLVLNVYTVLFFLAHIQATRLCPFTITQHTLHLQVGLTKRLTVPLSEIKQIVRYDGPERLSKQEEKTVFDGLAPDFIREKPAFEIEFYTPQQAKLMYGFTKAITKAHIRPDDPEAFYTALTKKLKEFQNL
ncbi:hypothetical protein P6P90_03175 [Ectobacillus antri]|jgi:membrane protein YdbS with pleckstrin-like domain|uniref:Beta-carotene 15,15'-monooxygenase n=1 Tax=Ectobacillus antri TaxID=2486280 RepID=A0ABT6H0U5_9BACI|nr:hypothetical protein [Ectobacillus antri]MDG4656326.1 hypothetical protein [Ectobacillus antri]MDG5753001.1 hypothetical protein [Ectobacillus antri]